MNPEPTGQLVPTPTGYDLILTRTYRAPVDDVWASVTEPERTARWFGPGAARPDPAGPSRCSWCSRSRHPGTRCGSRPVNHRTDSPS